MPLERIRISEVFPATPRKVYAAWIDGEKHAAMTGAPAAIDARVGGEHSAWDGYIRGRIVELRPNRRIVKTWRTSEFPDEAADSRVEIVFEEEGEDACRVTLVHTDIPEGDGAKYEDGWEQYYFAPMRAFWGQK
jgi:uncharacterized protein YndB with AHSA1/START domain